MALPSAEAQAPEQAPGAAIPGLPSIANIFATAPTTAQLPATTPKAAATAPTPQAALPNIFAAGDSSAKMPSLFSNFFATAPATPVSAQV